MALATINSARPTSLPATGVNGVGARPGNAPTAATQPTTTPPATSLPTNISPTYLSQLFPNGIPQAGVNQAGPSGNVVAPSVIQQIQAAAGQLPQVGTNSVLGAVGGQIGPQALQAEVTQAMQPQFGANQHALDEELANAGISGGSALGGSIDLANTENTQLAGALAPYEQSAQQNILNAATTDANNSLTASGQNAGNAITTGNNTVNDILQAETQNQNTNTSNDQFNAGQGNQIGEFNATNLLQAGNADAGSANSLQSQLLNINNQDWLQQLIGQQQIASGGQAGQTNAYTSTFQQPGQTSLSGFAPNIALPAQPTAPAPAPAPGTGTGIGGGTLQYA